MEHKVIRSNCGLCHGGCGILAYVRDGKLVNIEGDPECPTNRGALCPQGLAATQLVYHPDRIKYPLKRSGQRGEGKWQRISWDEALDTIASTIKEIREKDGNQAVGIAGGTGRPVNVHLRPFRDALGSPTFSPLHLCHGPTQAVGLITYGKFPAADLESARCIVNWSSNINYSSAPKRGRLLSNALKAGAKLITVDPCLSPIASRSDIWLQVRPGTDCALALAWLNVIIGENLYDKEFVENWAYGFDQLAEHVESFTPEWAEKITWVPAGKIRQAAYLYATTKPAAIHTRVPLEFGTNSTNNVRSVFILPAVTGNIDIPGGNVLWDHVITEGMLSKQNPEIWEIDWGSPLLLKNRITLAGHAAWRAILQEKPFPVKAMLFHGSNPIMSHENTRGHVYQAMMKVDFLSVMDIFMTPSAELADIVLPASTPFERDNVHNMTASADLYFPPTLCAAPKVIEPLWEAREDIEVFIDICNRLGVDYGATSVRDRMDKLLSRAAGIDFEQLMAKRWMSASQRWKKYEQGLLRPDKQPGFDTPTGKVELYCQELERLGLDPLPVYKEPPESPVSTPELAESFPLVLTTGYRSPLFFHSQYRPRFPGAGRSIGSPW
ncbi:molybdopterin-dependent oxidoreductase [Chloroflexota bacterium]